MILVAIPLLAGAMAWMGGRIAPALARWIALLALLTESGIALWLAIRPPAEPVLWLNLLYARWIPRFGIAVHLMVDGLSALLVLLTAILGLVALAAAWKGPAQRPGFFHCCLLWTVAGAVGVFLAMDLFLFFVFWEVMLVPFFFLLAFWGGERRGAAAIRFLLFTQGSSLPMLVSIVVLAIGYYRARGAPSFDYFALLGAHPPVWVGFGLMAGFFVAGAARLAVLPLHAWLADAQAEAPTAASILLAGVLPATGAYAMLRFTVPLFPKAAAAFAPVAMLLGIAGILFGAWLALRQRDLKRLAACAGVSQMGFVLLGIFAWSTPALNGVLLLIVANALSAGGFFLLVGALQEKLGTRQLRRLGGLPGRAPRLAAWGAFLAVAALGLPGLAAFAGHFLILLGASRRDVLLAALAGLGLAAAAAYALRMVQYAFGGRRKALARPAGDLGQREHVTLAVLAAVLAGIGIYPQALLAPAATAIAGLQRIVGG